MKKGPNIEPNKIRKANLDKTHEGRETEGNKTYRRGRQATSTA